MKLAAALVLVATGCWRDPPPPQTTTLRRAPALTCDTVIDHALEVLQRDSGSSNAARLRDAVVASCTRMAWSDDALACVNEAQSDAELDACREHMTPAQLQDLEALP